MRKQIAREDLIIGEEVKKFGGTWLITQQALIEHFGLAPLKKYIDEHKPKETVFIFSKNYSEFDYVESMEADEEDC